MIYKVYCKQVNKLFFWCVERINLFYSFSERIVFVNRGLPVSIFRTRTEMSKTLNLKSRIKTNNDEDRRVTKTECNTLKKGKFSGPRLTN